MKTVSNLEQTLFACLPAIAGGQASALLQKPEGLPSSRVGGDSPDKLVSGYQTSAREPQDLTPGWVGWVTETHRAGCSRGIYLQFTKYLRSVILPSKRQEVSFLIG